MKNITVIILSDGKTAKEVNPFGKEPTKPSMQFADLIRDYKYAKNKWQEAESKLRTFMIDYPTIEIGMYVWGLNKNGTPVQFEVVNPNCECDIECQISMEDIFQDEQIYLPGSQYSAEIIDKDKLIIRIV